MGSLYKQTMMIVTIKNNNDNNNNNYKIAFNKITIIIRRSLKKVGSHTVCRQHLLRKSKKVKKKNVFVRLNAIYASICFTFKIGF